MRDNDGQLNAPAKGRTSSRQLSAWPAYAFFLALMLITLLPPSPVATIASYDRLQFLEWMRGWRWIPVLLVSTPFWLSVIASLRLRQLSSEVRGEFELHIGPLPVAPAADPATQEREHKRWEQVALAATTTWKYERQRHLRSLQRLGLNVLIFGDVVAFVLVSCTLVFFHLDADALTLFYPEAKDAQAALASLQLLTLSIATAASTSFLVRFVRAIVRISSGDITCRMFAWAARSVALVVVAAIGLFVIFEEQVQTVGEALLLGLFAGATCDRALELLLDKAAALFKTTPPPARGPSPLLALEGITSEHVERLEEEGIYSIHDLAFVPTARLFFATAYSLQQICDWQDRALLYVYVGAKGVDGLAQHMKIIHASDLLLCCQTILNGQGPEREDLKAGLNDALQLDKGLPQLLQSMGHDELTMRVRLYWQSSVLTQEQLKQPERAAAGGPEFPALGFGKEVPAAPHGTLGET